MGRRRKSEESQGNHRTSKRQMGTYSTTSKSLDDDNREDAEMEGNSEGLFVKQRHTQRDHESTKDKLSKPGHVKFTSEYEEEGKTESQQFIDVLKSSKKRKRMKKGTKYLEDIKHIVDGQAETTGNFGAMAQQSLSVESHFFDFFIESHKKVVTDILSTGGIRRGRPFSLKDASTSITENGHQLLAAVERLGSDLGSYMLSTQAKEEEWNHNISKVETLLDAGKRVGEAKATTLLAGLQKQEPLEGNTDEACGALFGEAVDVQGSMTWADVAAKQSRAVRKLASAFPRD